MKPEIQEIFTALEKELRLHQVLHSKRYAQKGGSKYAKMVNFSDKIITTNLILVEEKLKKLKETGKYYQPSKLDLFPDIRKKVVLLMCYRNQMFKDKIGRQLPSLPPPETIVKSMSISKKQFEYEIQVNLFRIYTL